MKSIFQVAAMLPSRYGTRKRKDMGYAATLKCGAKGTTAYILVDRK